MKKSLKFIIPLIIVLSAFALETLLSWFPYFAFIAGKEGNRYSVLDGISKTIADGCCEFSQPIDKTKINSVSFFISHGEEYSDFYTSVSVYASPEDGEALRKITQKKFGVSETPQKKTVYLETPFEASVIMLKFAETGNTLSLSDVKINPVFTADFNTLRFIFIAVAALIIYFAFADKAGRKLLSGFSFGNVTAVTVVFSVCLSVAFSVVCITSDGAKMAEYPYDINLEYENPYVQQFDAFQKGQLYFDIEPDAQLAELENPYDPIERGNIRALWDRAYYNGKYYSYFGTAPIFTVYYPFYLITGYLPAESIVMAVFSVLASAFLPLAVMFLSRLIDKKISPWLASLTAIGTLGASMIYLIQRGYAPFYYIASLAGTAFASMTVFFTVLAYGRKNYAARIISFLLAGISFALCLHSRLNAALPVGIVIAVFVIAYFVKSIKSKKLPRFIGEAAALGIPILAAALAAMRYNSARFSGVFDFGTAYQLTVADTSTYNFSLSGIFPAIFHYFAQPFILTGEFPYIGMTVNQIPDIGKYVYSDVNIGIFAMPFMLSIFLSIPVLKSKKTSVVRKAVLIGALAAVFITAVLDCCLGGVIFRYTADIALLSAFICAGSILQLCSNLKRENRLDVCGLLYKGTGILFLAQSAVTAASMFMFDAYVIEYSPVIFEYVRSFFVFWK